MGTGLGLASMFLYPVDEKSPVSGDTVEGFYTSKYSLGAGMSQKTFSLGDRIPLSGLLRYGKN